jgi:hypothetical protein
MNANLWDVPETPDEFSHGLTTERDPTPYELLLKEHRERHEAKLVGSHSAPTTESSDSDKRKPGERVIHATELPPQPGMKGGVQHTPGPKGKYKDPLRTLMKAMGLKTGPPPDVGEIKVKRGTVPKVEVHDARGVTVVPNPCKLSHCHPPTDAHGLQLSLPHRTCYVGGVSSGKSASLAATLGHCHSFKRYGKLFLMSPNNELIRDSEYGIVDEITCLDSWPELEFWNSQPPRCAIICDDVSWNLSKRGKPSQFELAERTCGAMSSHHPGGIDIYIAQQTMVGIIPPIRRLLSHFCLFPKRLSQDSYPMIARTTMLDKRTLQRAFDHCQGPHSFLLVTNVNDGRPRLRVDGYKEVPAYL